jgi:hypothetical protein
VQWHFSRVSKIHEREFEVLPKSWFLLHEAHGRAANLVGILKDIPDFRSMSDSALEEFLGACRLPEHEKQRLVSTTRANRSKCYTDAMSWIELGDAETAQRILNNYLIENRIFMTAELAEAFRAVGTDLALVNSGYRSHIQYHLPESFTESADRFATLPPRIAKIESMIQDRLHYQNA